MMKSYVLIFVTLVASVLSHSYVTKPPPRRFGMACRIGGPPQFPVNCPGPCDAPKANIRTGNIQATSRGAALTVDWPRNNHGGGFIRLAWAKQADSDDFQAFNAGVQQVSCHETGFDGNPANTSPNRGCASDDPNQPFGGDTGGTGSPQEGSVRSCRLRTTVPTWLSDGLWTMQWTWFAASGGYLGDYYSCVDFNVAGGAALTAQQAAVFKGGDVRSPNANECSFSQADRPGYCWKEPCNDIWNTSFPFANGRVQKGQAYLVPLNVPTPPTPTKEPPAPVPTTVAAGPAPEIKVSVTVSLALKPNLVDLTVFVYEVAGNLNIPSSAVPNVVVDLDQSTSTSTIIHFTLINQELPDGTRVDPIAAAYKLKELSSGGSLKSTAFLSTMQVMSVSDDGASSSAFVGSQNFVIIIAVVGGVAVIGVAVAVVVVVIKKRKNGGFF